MMQRNFLIKLQQLEDGCELPIHILMGGVYVPFYKHNFKKMHTDSEKDDTLANTNNVLVTVFLPPFRVGKKQMRAVLDARGYEVVIFPIGLDAYALEYANFLNNTRC